MTSLNIPRQARRALQTQQWVVNGRYPDASMYTLLAADANHCARYLTKQIFTWSTPIANIPTAATQTRWRFAFHTSPMVRIIWCRAVLGQCDSTAGTDCYATVTIKTTGGSTIGTCEFHFGSSDSQFDTPAYFGIMTGPLSDSGSLADVTTDADLVGEVTDTSSRIVALSVWEEALASDDGNGYLPDSFTVDTPIFDNARERITTLLRNQWKSGGQQLINWTVDKDSSALTRTSATAVNVIDGTSTAPSSSTPGFTLDLSHRSTVRRTTVPCKFAAYSGMSLGGTGAVELVDSTNTVKASIAIPASNAWVYTTVSLPASSAKYDLRFKSDGTHTANLFAISLYEYE